MRTAWRVAFLVVLVLVCLSLWVGVRGWLAKDHLEASADLVQRLQTQVEAGSTGSARTTLGKLQRETADAMRLTSDPVWRTADHFPWFGDDLTAVHAVSVAGHTVSIDALPPLTAAAADVHNLRNSGGDLTPAQVLAVARRLKAPLAQAKAGVGLARQQIAAADTSGLMGPVRTGVNQLSSGLAQMDAELSTLITTDNAVLKAGAKAGH